MKKSIILLFILTTLICKAQEIAWVVNTSEKSKISFKLPEKAYLKNSEINGIKSEIFSFKDISSVYGIVASDFSALDYDFSHSDTSVFFEQMKRSSLTDPSAKLISERSVAYKRMIIKEITYTQKIKNSEYTYYKRFIFKGQYLYQISIGGPSKIKQILLNKKYLFFNSIEFL